MRGYAVVHVHPPARVSARNARTCALHKHTRTSPTRPMAQPRPQRNRHHERQSPATEH